MKKLETFALLILLLLALAACGQEAAPEPTTTTPTDEPTPAPTATPEPVALSYADPDSQGIPPEALGQLAAVVRGYFEDDIIVGGELVVIKNRRTVLHEAIGWKDRDAEVPMERDTLFNIRSMTKPVIGTAIQMLVDEGKLALDDRVSQYLPAFEDDESDQIIIEHLLTHRSGLPLSLLSSFEGHASIQDVADQAGGHGPDFKPGSDFQYSDTGSDVLGAVLEKVSGLTIDQFLEQRIIGPLAMSDTITLLGEGDPRSARVASAYFGSAGDWSRFWGPDDEPIYPFAMGSQGLYCTPLDYARFLALWMDGGLVGERRLLSLQAVERALTPVSEMGTPSGFPGCGWIMGRCGASTWPLTHPLEPNRRCSATAAPTARGPGPGPTKT
jgi:CubicO group peptidase (beta-lactamase class C family)